ncbi:pyridoxal-dependent decarboxylase [Granulicella mallensis]|uniref:Aromatic-L-amino-acid decarboxylase n=2 Tax=Granulicella mallensis TaxID=940614 RepID=G8P0F1_GRAMM|nr:pyridoxal-dependent decarboxylase [Granulicella mallensis]AEU38039.1 Aromatic-L-amino-acid decarboxylase [Granulicella mallensis MP5ACTX8]MBB5066740.1 glutamate/tyrosine decarboxylase-like PLP-dependent enzyme [Granulicella mallensis]
MNESEASQNVSLDPEDWEEFRTLGHQILDDMVEYLKDVRERPTWQSPSAASRDFLQTPLPKKGSSLTEVYRDVKEHILPYPTGNIHPRFWGWVMGTGTHVGVLADLIGSTMNCHVSGYDQGATLVERQVIHWLGEMLDFPKGTSGLLVSGGTVANLLGITAARNSLAGTDIRKEGLGSGTGDPLVIYGSEATHGWAERCCDLLGLGSDGFRKVPVDDHDRIEVGELARMIQIDRNRGMRPICIVGTAGTVSTGATDDLIALADLAQAEGLWFHVDGAFGALAKLSPRYRYLVNGLERADSVAFDLHKWGYMQFETGAVLIRDGKAHEKAFSFAPSYLENFSGGIAVKPTEFASKGIQLSRSFRALRVWMNLSVYGVEKLGQAIEQNIDDSFYLASRVEAEPDLELLAPVVMNVVCFRFVQDGFSDRELDELNSELLVRLQESGVAVPSNARIDGRFAIRVANTNHRTIRSDFDLLISSTLELGRRLAGWSSDVLA